MTGSQLDPASQARSDAPGERAPEKPALAIEVQPGDLVLNHPAVGVAARILFTLIFFLSGVTHFTDIPRYVALMPEAIPFRTFWVLVSGVVELAGAILILLNVRPRLGAWLIVLFLVPVTITVHGVGIFSASSELMRSIQTSMFLKGMAMTGGALFVTQLGVRPQRTSR